MQCHLNHGGWCHLLECNWLIFIVHFGPFEAHFWPQILSNASRIFWSGSVSWDVESQIGYSREFFAPDNYAFPSAEYNWWGFLPLPPKLECPMLNSRPWGVIRAQLSVINLLDIFYIDHGHVLSHLDTKKIRKNLFQTVKNYFFKLLIFNYFS